MFDYITQLKRSPDPTMTIMWYGIWLGLGHDVNPEEAIRIIRCARHSGDPRYTHIDAIEYAADQDNLAMMDLFL